MEKEKNIIEKILVIILVACFMCIAIHNMPLHIVVHDACFPTEPAYAE